MDTPMVPAWLEAALAYATVAITAMTALARILDRVVPQLQAVEARSGARGLGASGFVARVAGALTQSLAHAQRYIPQVTIGSAPARAIVAPPERTTREPVPVVSDDAEDDDDPDDSGPGSAGAALVPTAPERRPHPEPHGPFARG